jgi:hypothetical protein
MTAYCSTPVTLRLELLNSAGTVTNSLDLMDQANGYRVGSFDVGFPAVRAITSPLPTRDGEYDTSRYYGPRTVTVTGAFVPSPAGSRQKALSALTWWCQPRLRPRVVYALDGDSAALWLNLRGSQLSAPSSNPQVTDFSVSWVAPDPIARALTTTQITVNPGATGTATNNGTYRAWPILDIYGPCTNPAVIWTSPAVGQVVFTGLTVATGHYVEVDCRAQTALTDANPTQSVYPNIDFANTRWAGIEPGANTLQFTAATSSSPSRVVVTWADSSI